MLGADQPYVPQQTEESNGLVDFLTSAQAMLGIVVVLTAAVLLVWQTWSSRREDRQEREKGERRKDAGQAG
jgi:predicted negative regulator of RcsB-dependent stress response